jgi:hypothetical protein
VSSSLLPISIASHSLVYSSRITSIRNGLLSVIRSCTPLRHIELAADALDREMLATLVENFERVMAEGTNPQKKDLLRRMVKNVRFHGRRTVEIWCGLPNQVSVRTRERLASRM